MLVSAIGVLQDGLADADPNAEDERRPLRIRRGASVTVQYALTDVAGAPINLTGATLTLRIRPRQERARALLSIAVTGITGDAARDGRATFTLTATQTARLDPGMLVYDVQHTASGGGIDFVTPTAALIVEDTSAA